MTRDEAKMKIAKIILREKIKEFQLGLKGSFIPSNGPFMVAEEILQVIGEFIGE